MILKDSITTKENIGGGVRMRGQLYAKYTTKAGKEIFKKVGENTTLIGGTQRVGMMLMGMKEEKTKIQTLDTDGEGHVFEPAKSVTNETPRLFGFGVSIDGVKGTTVSTVKRVSKGYNIGSLIPFRMIPKASEDPRAMLEKYAARATVGNYVRYYVKKFDGMELYNRESMSGLDLPDLPHNIIGPESDVPVETVIDLRFGVSKEELREFFHLTYDNMEERRLSSISLFFGNEVITTVAGLDLTDFRNIICTNRLNFKERELGIEGDISFVYLIYLY